MKEITFLKPWCKIRWYKRRRHVKRALIWERQLKLKKPLYKPPRRDFSRLPRKRQVIKIRKLLWDELPAKCPGITPRPKLTRSLANVIRMAWLQNSLFKKKKWTHWHRACLTKMRCSVYCWLSISSRRIHEWISLKAIENKRKIKIVLFLITKPKFNN